MKKIIVSIVIVNYNGKSILKKTLDSFRKIKDIPCEIIVVDNASTDGSADFIRTSSRDIKLIQNKTNLGYTGINSALPHCRGGFIFFTNNDAALERGALKKLCNVLRKDATAGIAAPKVINFFDRHLQSGGTWVSRSLYNGHFKSEEKDALKDIPYMGIALIRKSIVDRFGYLFDQDYFIYAEDVDLGLRLRLMGYKVIHVPGAVLYHMHSATTKKGRHYKSTFLLERNSLMTFFKIMPVGRIFLFLPYVLLMRIVALLKDVVMLHFPDAFARLGAMAWILLHAGAIAEKRKLLRPYRKCSMEFLSRAFSEKYVFSTKKINV